MCDTINPEQTHSLRETDIIKVGQLSFPPIAFLSQIEHQNWCGVTSHITQR